MKTLPKLLLALVMGLLPLALLEIGLRTLIDPNSAWNIRIGAEKEFDPISQFRIKPNWDYGNGVHANELGYLAPDGLTKRKPEGVLRFIYIGDSVTYLPVASNYPRNVERLLEERKGVEIETVNAAVPGFNSRHARARFEHELSQFEGDYLFVYLGWNDLSAFGPEGLPYKRRTGNYELSPFQRALTHVHSVRLIYALEAFLRRGKPTLSEPLEPELLALYDSYYPTHYEENLRAIVELARDEYAHIYLLNLATITTEVPGEQTELAIERAHFPRGMAKNVRTLHMLISSYNRAVDAVSRSENVPVVDLYSAFDSLETKRLLRDSCHVVPEGAAHIAAQVVAAVERDWPGG